MRERERDAHVIIVVTIYLGTSESGSRNLSWVGLQLTKGKYMHKCPLFFGSRAKIYSFTTENQLFYSVHCC